MGTLQMVIASVVMGIVGAFADGTAMPMVIGFAACALAALAITLVTLRRNSGSEPAAVAAPAE
jgi:MFS transporter, DHA1 family, multidrug resistance protein